METEVNDNLIKWQAVTKYRTQMVGITSNSYDHRGGCRLLARSVGVSETADRDAEGLREDHARILSQRQAREKAFNESVRHHQSDRQSLIHKGVV